MQRPGQRQRRAGGPLRLVRLVLLLVLGVVVLGGRAAEAKRQPQQQLAPYKAHFSDFYQARRLYHVCWPLCRTFRKLTRVSPICRS